ncbi:hypothetical protein E6H35_04695 [Candidatus Bathyarchaeota archaeon]|nr:MAG: hypothetical protein E6H35_04695 [Candidatus Bathyarchaeota archaeon]
MSTVTRITVVHTTNMLIIYTEEKMPLRVDNSTTENLWTLMPDGTVLWLPVTQLHAGDSLLTQHGWKTVTRTEIVTGGDYSMYDISATGPYFANGYLDPPIPS